MRVDAETRAFFETLMTETPPAAQTQYPFNR